MNPTERVVTKRGAYFKMALAVAVLVLVLWWAGLSVQTTFVTAVVVLILWVAIRSGRRRYHNPLHS